MADNVPVTGGSGHTIAADEVTRNATPEKQQIIKISLGADGAFDNLVDSGEQPAAASLPVVRSSDAATHETMASLQGSALTGTYQALLTLTGNAREVLVYNGTDTDVKLSWDGTNDHFFVPAGLGLDLKYKDLDRHVASGGVLRVKHNGAAGSAGLYVWAMAIK